MVTTLKKQLNFPVDIVYTWVDQSDPVWIKKRWDAISLLSEEQRLSLCRDGIQERELEPLNQLKFSLRSVSRYAGFIRKIFIVTDDQIPAWLNTAHPKIEIISHRTIFGNEGKLPTFTSHAIESRLHHIPGLSEHFLYLNDDFFLGKTISTDDFFIYHNKSKFFPSPQKIATSAPSPDDLGIASAAKQGQALLKKQFKLKVSHYISHIPYPLRRSILFEMENRFKTEFKKTASHQFRHSRDFSIPAFLFFYYSYATNRAVPAKISYMYLDSSLLKFIRKAFFLLIRRYKTFCINGGHRFLKASRYRHKLLAVLLKLAFPGACEFETTAVLDADSLKSLNMQGEKRCLFF